MSMNLCFTTKIGVHHVDFPFQTSTDLTYAVLKAKDEEARMKLIKDEVMNFVAGGLDKEHGDDIIERVRELMRDKSLVLSLI